MNINYDFKNPKLLDLALTHISYANDTHTESNQRLEFLGDSILSYVIATKLYELYPKCQEGELTKIRAALVCEGSLAELSRRMEVGGSIKFGRSEAVSRGAKKDSILADAFEAILGAIFLDSGIETAQKWTLDIFGDRIQSIAVAEDVNFKSELQIYFQKRDKGCEVVTYALKQKSGPDHDPEFWVEAVYQNKIIGEGKGKSRKLAEQKAAKQALEKIKKL